MAKRREGWRRLEVEAPEELVERLEAAARANYRSLSDEVREACRRHVKAEEARQRAEATAVDLAAAPPAPKRGRKGGA
jgi:metal-responsive CopG/Arc/MetJ family transcriptional regulator